MSVRHSDWTKKDETLKDLRQSSILLKRFFCVFRSRRARNENGAREKRGKDGGRCRNFRVSTIACEFLVIQYKSTNLGDRSPKRADIRQESETAEGEGW